MIGLKTLFGISLVAGPMAVMQAVTPPTVITTDSLIPLGLVLLLIAAVFKAGKEVQRLNAHMEDLVRLRGRVSAIEQHLGMTVTEIERHLTKDDV